MDTPSRSAFALDFACALSVAPLLSIARPELPLTQLGGIFLIAGTLSVPAFRWIANRGSLLTPGLWALGLRRSRRESRWMLLLPEAETALRGKVAWAFAFVLPAISLLLAWDAHPVLGGLLPEERIEAQAEARDRPLPWFLFTLQVPAVARTDASEPFIARLPYARGIPRRFIPSVEFRLPDGSLRFIIDAPRKPENWDWVSEPGRVRECFREDALLKPACILERERLVAHARARVESAFGPSVAASGMRAVESGAWETPLVSGFLARFQSGLGRAEFRAALNSEGEMQGWMVFVQEGALPELEQEGSRISLDLARGAMPFRDLRASRIWLDSELQRIRLPSADEQLGALGSSEGASDVRLVRQEFDALSLVQLALLSKLTVEPSSFDAFFHLAGTSFLKWKLSRKLGLPQHMAASAAMVESSARYLADLQAMDPRTRQIEDLLQRMRALQK